MITLKIKDSSGYSKSNNHNVRHLHEKWKCDKTKIINNAKDRAINDLLNKYNKPTLETDEEKVIRILKKDFEEKHGMTFDKFIETYQKILEESPEKLI